MDGETAAELAALIAPGDAHLAEAFGATKLAPRMAALCMLWSWVQQAEAEARASTIASAAPAREAGLLLWGQLLDLSASDPELSAARCTDLGKVHRKKVSRASDGLERQRGSQSTPLTRLMLPASP